MLGWNAPPVFVFAWVETVIVGVFILLRGGRAEGDRDAYWRDAERSPYTCEPSHLTLAWRFFRTGLVATVAFGLIGFGMIAASTEGGDAVTTTLEAVAVSLVTLVVGAATVCAAQGVIYLRDYVGGGKYLTAVSGDLESRYIGAVLPVAGAWLVGIFMVAGLGAEHAKAPLATTLGLVVIKTAGDLTALWRRRRRIEPST